MNAKVKIDLKVLAAVVSEAGARLVLGDYRRLAFLNCCRGKVDWRQLGRISLKAVWPDGCKADLWLYVQDGFGMEVEYEDAHGRGRALSMKRMRNAASALIRLHGRIAEHREKNARLRAKAHQCREIAKRLEMYLRNSGYVQVVGEDKDPMDGWWVSDDVAFYVAPFGYDGKGRASFKLGEGCEGEIHGNLPECLCAMSRLSRLRGMELAK